MVNDVWPPRRRYDCRRTPAPPLDGRLRGAWDRLPWSEDFRDITGEESLKPRFRTRMKMGWDEDCLYVGAEMEEPHVWGTITETNAVMFHDNDFEVFLDPDGDGENYYELEINALGTVWELSLPKPYAEGGVPVQGCNLPGLKKAVHVDGTLNDPSDIDRGWSLTLALPWRDLAPYRNGCASAPERGEIWRANFSRVQWRHQVIDGRYVRIPPHGTPMPESLDPEDQHHPEDNWVWSPQGAVNMHLPRRWGEIAFVD